MLKKFSVKNYKNFQNEIVIDFKDIAGYQFNSECITDGIICKMLIYGRNAVGKTNFGKAIMDIRNVLGKINSLDDTVFLNADSKEKYALFSYTFQFGDSEVLYKYTRGANRVLHSEELMVDGTQIFKFNFSDKKIEHNFKAIDAETVAIDRYFQSLYNENDPDEIIVSEYSLPLLRWLINNTALRSDSLLLKLADYVSKMRFSALSTSIAKMIPMITYENFFQSLGDAESLNNFEEFLNLMGISCKLVVKKLPEGQNALYFSHDKLIPFLNNASSGTLALTAFYNGIVSSSRDASFIYLDEFDAFYHYEMAENIINFFKKKYPRCQIIMTSHNTNLITNRLMRPDCLFILSQDGNLTALCNATLRELREGHNLEKMYISGEFKKYE